MNSESTIKFIIKLADGGVTRIEDDHEYVAGCPTCDYGSKYINDLWFTLTKYFVSIHVNKEYGYGVSGVFLIRLIYDNAERISKMTEEECVNFISCEFQKLASDNPYTHKPDCVVEVSVRERLSNKEVE